MPRPSFAQPLVAAVLLAACATLAFGQPPAAQETADEAVQEAEIIELPANLSLTNAGGKSARPPAPAPNMDSKTTLLPQATKTLDQMIAEQDEYARKAGRDPTVDNDGKPLPPEIAEQTRNMVFGVSQQASLHQANLPTISKLPEGMALDVLGGVWLADGGYLPPGTSTVLGGGGFVTTTNTKTGGAPYGSATTYQVAGDMITINKGIQIGNQPMVMANLTVRSGQTATVRLPDGSILQITPTLRPLTPQEIQRRATTERLMAESKAKAAAAAIPRP